MASRIDDCTSSGPRWRRILALGMLLSLPTLAPAQRRTALDYGLAVNTTALIVADWSQALRIADNPDRWAEANPLVGRHPSEGRVNTMETLYLLWNGAALLLPKTPRRIWYAAVTVVEAVAVAHNLAIGISIGF